jgi:predicted enzyme related to lactoylglutathione lyase
MHFSIVVKSVDESIRFYMAIAPLFSAVSDMTSGSGERFVDIGVKEGNVFLQLMQPHEISEARIAYMQKRGRASIRIDVDDIDSEVTRLRNLGYVAKEVQTERSFQFATYIDPDGNEITLQSITIA